MNKPDYQTKIGNDKGSSNANRRETAALQPSRGISTVKLEIDIPVLMNIFGILAQSDHKEILQRFLTQLKNEEYFYDEDVSAWAAHYQLGSPLFW